VLGGDGGITGRGDRGEQVKHERVPSRSEEAQRVDRRAGRAAQPQRRDGQQELVPAGVRAGRDQFGETRAVQEDQAHRDQADLVQRERNRLAGVRDAFHAVTAVYRDFPLVQPGQAVGVEARAGRRVLGSLVGLPANSTVTPASCPARTPSRWRFGVGSIPIPSRSPVPVRLARVCLGRPGYRE